MKEMKEPKTQAEISVNEPHDKGYKKSLSKPGEFLHFLRKYVDHTMIFRVLVYVVNTLVKYFMDMDKKERERADFRLPTMVPIVFYNGLERWSAATDLKSYQNNGTIFENHILNLEYYLVNLADIGEEYILSTNTVLDNIMYCDKSRKKLELAGAIRTAYGRVQELGLQEREEFRNWVKYILLSVCGNKEAVVEEILNWAGNGEDDMAFKYNIIKAFEEEREEGKAEGKAEDIIDLLEELGDVSEKLLEKLYAQKNLDILKKWLKLAARSQTMK